MTKIRALAIHLPQFHTIPENDEWWGKGFTEWTNTRKEKPRFKGHYQPHTPLNENYYDLSDVDSLKHQVALAKKYLIDGFCFYHYWFDGKLLLEKPLENLINDKTIDFPFCLSWANENWTRRWDGKDNEVLVGQNHSIEDDKKHIEYLLKYFKDERYIKVNGAPVLLIYKTELIPHIKETLNMWNEYLKQNGFPGLYTINMESTSSSKGVDKSEDGFSAAMDFQPNWANLPRKERETKLKRFVNRTLKRSSSYSENKIFSYFKYFQLEKNRIWNLPYKIYPTVVPSWDNSARRVKGAVIFKGASPKLYGEWLNHILLRFKPFSEEENFVFINAWNEWAEGNHLEPCKKWGYKYLEITKKYISELNSKG